MNKLIIRIYLLLSLMISFSLADTSIAQINRIKIEGNKRLSNDDIIRISNIFPGMQITAAGEIQQGINRLWDLNRFNDIKIILDNETKEGMDLIIQLEEADMLNEIFISGNKKFNNKKIKDIIELEKGQILTDKSIFECIVKLTQEYKTKGYHNIEITHSIQESNFEYASNLTLKIIEGNKLKIKNINFKGNSSFSDKKLKRIFKKNKEKVWYLPWKGKYLENEIEMDKLLVSNFYHNKGFKDFYFIEDLVDFKDNSIDLNYKVYEGPKYIHRSLKWEGNSLFSDSTLTNAMDINNGDIYSLEKFNFSLFQNISPLYMDKGYLNFNINHSYEYNNSDSLDIVFNIVENNIVKVRKIIIKGNHKTNENVIRREVDIYPGDIFNRTKFIDVRTRIMLLNLFENVIPDILPFDEDEVDLIIEVVEKGVGQANFTMGWNRVQGFNGGGGFQLPNFLGRGQTISLNYNRGLSSGSTTSFNTSNNSSNSIAQSFSISFFEPALYDTPNMIGASYSYYETPSSRTISGLDVNSSSISISFGKRKLNWPDNKFKVTWAFTKSTKTYSSNDQQNILNSFAFVSENQIDLNNDKYEFKSSGVSISQVLKRKSLNHPEFPTTGSDFTWDLTYSGGVLGGREDYIKSSFSFNFFIPISDKISIGNMFKFGNIERISENSIIPPQKYFVMGGSGIPYGEMLRGYPENSVGPYYYENNYPVGGKLLSRYSIEGRLLFSSNPTIYGFIFADAGNVWSGFNTVDPYSLKRSAGLGIRLFMPMLGLIGYDIGYGFDPSGIGNDNSPWGWDHHLIFGAGIN